MQMGFHAFTHKHMHTQTCEHTLSMFALRHARDKWRREQTQGVMASVRCPQIKHPTAFLSS